MISIIIPCYNGYRYMSKCLGSLESKHTKILRWSYDDCSTDDSFDQLATYFSHSKLKSVLIKNNKNVGPGESRNRAIDASTGNYLMFCDCDDWYEENALKLW